MPDTARPRKRKPASAAPVSDAPVSDAPTSEVPDEASADQPAPADDAVPDVPVFANRAERRARGKGGRSAQSQPPDKGHYPGGHGAVQRPRQWGNRRSGG